VGLLAAPETDYPSGMRFPLFALGLPVFLPLFLTGCSDDPAPPARVYIVTQVGQGTESGVNDSAKCGLPTQEWLRIGTREVPVESGAKIGDTRVEVTCSVKQEGAGFRIALNAFQERTGSFLANGLMTSSGPQQGGITGSFTRGDTGTFAENNCSVNFEGDTAMGIGPGKIWGNITCDHATARGGAQLNGQDRTCKGVTIPMRFERCDK
jgi:hypothetical protein